MKHPIPNLPNEHRLKRVFSLEGLCTVLGGVQLLSKHITFQSMKILISLLIAGLLVPSLSFAATTAPNPTLISQLQAELATLQNELAAYLSSGTSGTAAVTDTDSSISIRYETSLAGAVPSGQNFAIGQTIGFNPVISGTGLSYPSTVTTEFSTDDPDGFNVVGGSRTPYFGMGRNTMATTTNQTFQLPVTGGSPILVVPETAGTYDYTLSLPAYGYSTTTAITVLPLR